MKKYHHHHYFVFIFVFVVLGLLSFFIRDDLKSSFDSLISNLKNRKNNISITLEEKSYEPIRSVDLPGALRVKDVTKEIKQIILSKNEIIKFTNKNREDNGGLSPLKENETLDRSAAQKLKDMFDKQYFDHISPSKKSISDLAKENSYEYILIGENLALGNFKNDEDLVNAWMSSSGHRANILNKNYTDIGVAVGRGLFEGKNVWIAVQHFGAPRSICPSIDDKLYGIILMDKDNISNMSQDLGERQTRIKNGAIYEGMSFYEQIIEYNKLVNDYNILISETKQKIEEYNKQVQLFNICLLNFK